MFRLVHAPSALAVALVTTGCAQGSQTPDTTGFTQSGGDDGTGSGTGASSGATAGSTATMGTTSTAGSTGSTSVSSTTAGPGSTGRTTGQACPGAPFRVDLVGSWLSDVVVASDRIIATGWEDGVGGRLFAFDPCDGAVIDERVLQYEGQVGMRLARAQWVDDKLLVAGSTPTQTDVGDGFWARILPATLEGQWEKALLGGPTDDRVLDLAGENGDVLIAGVGNVADPQPWIITANSSGSACGFAWPLGNPTTGEARAVAFASGQAFAFVHGITDADYAVRYEPGCACPCSPTAEFPIDLGMGEDDIVVNAAGASGNQLLAAGAYIGADPVDLKGFVVAMSPLSGVVSAKWTVDPTAQGDGWVALAEGSNRLYLAGGKDWDGVSNEFLGASAWMVALPLPLTNNPTPSWEYEPAGVDVGTGVAVDEGNGVVYFVGNAGGAGVLMACTIDGVCPD